MNNIVRIIVCLLHLVFTTYSYAALSQVNKSLVVGEIPITSDVTAFGARTYSVPINAYPGMNGLTPSLSFVYNSQYGKTTLGHGWVLGGLNMIVRVPKNMYHDGVVAAIKIDSEDAFVIDGIRFVEQSKTSTTRNFETEQGNVKAIAYLNDTIITHFDVFYPDGRKGVFGYSDNSNQQIYYPLTKLYDSENNTIDYEYILDTNYYYISKISYNGDLSIEFEYIKSRQDAVLVYMAGRLVRMQYLLSNVKCKFGETELCRYELRYKEDGGNSLLLSISYSSGEDSFNPLEFSYGTNYASSSYKTEKINISGDYHISSAYLLKIVKGKFGISQDDEGIITVQEKNPYYDDSQKRFLNKYNENQTIYVHSGLSGEQTTDLPSIKTGAGFIDFICADLRGNCHDCIIKINDIEESDLDKVSFNIYENTGSTIKNTITRTYSFPTIAGNKKGYKSIQPKFYYPGDFNGDGKMEVLAVSAHQALGSSSPVSEIYIFDLLNDSILYKESVFPYAVTFLGSNLSDSKEAEQNSDKLFVMDCDGDGKSDFCYINSKGIYTYTFDVNETGLKIRLLSFTTNPSGVMLRSQRLLPGDFDGDGVGDFVVAPAAGNEKWAFLIGKGNGKFGYSERNFETEMIPNENTSFFVSDVNNDGTTDLIFVNRDEKPYTGYDKFCTHIVRNFDIIESVVENLRDVGEQIVQIDINSWPRSASLIGISDDIISKYTFRRDESKDLCLTRLINSFGVRQENMYHAIGAKSPAFTVGHGASFPYASIAIGKTVMTEGKTYLDDVLVDSETYRYENAVVNLQGLGFCGFEKIVKKNFHDRSETSVYSPTEYGLLKSKESTTAKIGYNYDIDHRQYGLTKIRLTSKIEDDLLNENHIVTKYEYDAYGYPTYEHADIYDYGSITRTIKYDSYPFVGDILPYSLGLPVEETTVVSKNGATYETKTTNKYRLRAPTLRCHFVNGNKVGEERYTYDDLGNQLSMSETRYSSKNSKVTSYEYDRYGRVTVKTDPIGFKEEYTYDTYGRQKSIEDKRGNITTYIYDSFGRKISETAPDGTSSSTSWVWETEGSGLYSVIRAKDGALTIKEVYDGLNRLVEKSELRFDGVWLKSFHKYDKYGNLSGLSLPTKNNDILWTRYEYDQFDRLTSITDPQGKKSIQWYEPKAQICFSDGIEKAKIYNSRGELVSVIDPSGTIEYTIGADGQVEKIVTPDGQETIFGYDEYRRRVSVKDANSGIITYSYDDDGNLIWEDINDFYCRGYKYDEYDRLVWKQIDVSEYYYNYDEFGELKSISNAGYPENEYDYDSFGRLISEKEIYGENIWFRKSYSYSNGNIDSVEYESELGKLVTETYTYSNGHLLEIKLDNGSVIYKLDLEDDRGITAKLKTGDFVREYGYTASGLPCWRRALHSNLNVQNYNYKFDIQTTNLISRTDSILNRSEQFAYDYQNRLISWQGGEAEYDCMGAVSRRSDIGEYSYTDDEHPYAVTEIRQNSDAIPLRAQTEDYYFAGYPSHVRENDIIAQFEYDAELNRKCTFVRDLRGKKSIIRRYYFGDCYELEISSGAPAEERLYLGGSNYYDAVAVLIKSGEKQELHYIFRDYLGSITQLCKEDGTLVQELEYNPWGVASMSERCPRTDGDSIMLIPRIGRGFIGHEHLHHFGLINMNARLYDPVIGRFLSPDPILQFPDWSQNYNRYTYAMNNPFRFVDEDGESALGAVLIGALVGGAINIAANWDAICESGGGWSSIWKATQYFCIGGVAGGAGGAVVAAMPAAVGFLPGMISGVAGGGVEGFLLGFGNGCLDHQSIGASLGAALKGAAVGALSGGVGGGVMGAIEAHALGRNVITGAIVKNNNLQSNLKLSLEGLDLPVYNVNLVAPNSKGTYTVYYGYNPGPNKDKVIRYIGITEREPTIRYNEHLISNGPRASLDFDGFEKSVIPNNGSLTRMEARIWEQKMIMKYRMQKHGGLLYNKRFEIAPKNWKKYKIENTYIFKKL